MTTYVLNYRPSEQMIQRAMTSWARAENPQQSGLAYFVIILMISLCIGGLLGVSGALDLITPTMLIATLIGFYLGLMFWFVMHRRQIRKLSGLIIQQLDKQGPTQATLSPDGVEMRSALGQSASAWRAYDQVVEIPGATVLRLGGVVIPFPHSALADGVDPAAFHRDVSQWQRQAQ